MRRVVVTGIGLVSPFGIGTANNWQRLIAGESGLRAIQSFDVSDMPARIAGQVPRGDKGSHLFNADDWVLPKDQRKMDMFIVFAICAAIQAVEDWGWMPRDEEGRGPGSRSAPAPAGFPPSPTWRSPSPSAGRAGSRRSSFHRASSTSPRA